MEIKEYTCDVLVIGSGGAGCKCGIVASKEGQDVIIVSKGLTFKSGCTMLAEGGYNAVFGYVDDEDSLQLHIQDTLKGGAFLNDLKLVYKLVTESPKRLVELESYGSLFDRQEDGRLNQRAFGGQSYRRTCFKGDQTGHEMMVGLKEEVIREGVETHGEIMITKLLFDKNHTKIVGAMGFSLQDSSIVIYHSKTTVIASGGCGWLYPVTSNALQKTGDGIMMAYDVGADVMDMEMVQFHPTGMLSPKSRRGVLITEAVRGEGGYLINTNNERFMINYDPRQELATRDIVARSIYTEIQEGRGTKDGGVYLSVTHLPDSQVHKKLQTMVQQFKDVGVDITKEPMEVAPTAHHFMGGVRINTDCETNIENLYAAGEASSGVHGANRLGGNALADTQVFGHIAGLSSAKQAQNTKLETPDEDMISSEISRIEAICSEGKYRPQDIKTKIQEIMWKYVAIVRDETGLKQAEIELNKLEEMTSNMNVSKIREYNDDLVVALEVISMIKLAKLIVKSALLRKESRGAHYRIDYPERNDKEYLKSFILNKNGEIKTVERGLFTDY
ncbi:fumarate reductase (CoM/CoB) subunit TfrA [Methanosphaera sp.]|uniref:fumarate reductase (CoM/CoB) subunit TfrA n=1 Tax=Methanosphaera sp. TaxID=2666342 RepID=UPI0026DFDFE1|nr:fumarate reductase (CoM/CoB) subunit TfrA [Methanosphaera sp.]MDO5821847.1 fumarate reductase (CoM/CoB) subunit TfrA [Methanosphaera sp.]